MAAGLRSLILITTQTLRETFFDVRQPSRILAEAFEAKPRPPHAFTRKLCCHPSSRQVTPVFGFPSRSHDFCFVPKLSTKNDGRHVDEALWQRNCSNGVAKHYSIDAHTEFPQRMFKLLNMSCL